MAQFDYNFSVIGDCANSGSGAISVSLSGGVPPYIIDFVSPNLGTGATKTNLSAGVYTIRVNDSLGDINNEFFINAIVSSGGCLNVTDIVHTTCGEDNGSIVITGDSTAYPITLKLFSGSTVITSGITNNGLLSFSNLASGVYQAYYEDYGGCSGFSESIIINPSNELDFDFYVVDDTQCFGNVGKLQITGLTGTPPYNYLWSNGSTGTTITGLTAGTYSVTISDAGGCVKTKVGTVNNAPTLEIASIITTPPNCFSSDGTVSLIVTGGTGPFYYSGDNGTTLITYSRNVTFSGYTAGPASFKVTDSTLCSAESSTYLQAPAGFSVVNLITKNSTCSISGGTATINLIGVPPFIYTLVYPDSSSIQTTEISSNKTFTDLVDGDYTIIISNAQGCTYTQDFTIFTSDKFSVSLNVTGTTCGLPNGKVDLFVGSGYTGVLDMIVTKNNSPVVQYIDVPQTAVTFNNLSSGIYRVQVRDEDNCSVYRDFTISTSQSLNFGLNATSCGNNNNEGTISANIYSGVPPFTYLWSQNVNGQTGPNLVGLSGGNYTLTITDSSGCTLSRNINVPCSPLVNGYQILSVISDEFTLTNNTERNFLTMLNEGFYDLTTGNTNCVLSSATFVASVEISGNTYQQSFYTATTINDVPSESLWVETLENIISGVTGVGTYTINATTNLIQVKSICDGDVDSLSDSEFVVGLNILYDIYCVT